MSYQRFYEEKRYCLYCGKDISDRQLSAKICDNPECEKMRQHEKYLENKNGKNKKHRICMICGCDISNLPSQSKICKKEECQKIR